MRSGTLLISLVLLTTIRGDSSGHRCVIGWTEDVEYGVCTYLIPEFVQDRAAYCKTLAASSEVKHIGGTDKCATQPSSNMPVPGMGGGGLPGK